jgi:SAM-dependent methyltransferase
MKSIEKQEAWLRGNVYYTKSRWPFYELLLKDLRRLSSEKGRTLAVERCFRTDSRLAPYFWNFESFEAEYAAKQQEWEPLPNLVQPDLVVIHNLIHHTRDVNGLIADMARILRPDGRIYVFEATFRELHQEPYHWQMFTPYGMQDLLERHGFEVEDERRTGDPFEAALYCLDQGLQYIPDTAYGYRESEIKQGRKEHKPASDCFQTFAWKVRTCIQHLQRRPRKGMELNLERPNSSFPTAYSMTARKPK